MSFRASPKECFAERRVRFLKAFPGPAAFGSGLGRVRNFEANRFPFRAESHFLYFIGQHLEGALLSFDAGEATLYVPASDPKEALWRSQVDPARLAEDLGIEVLPSDDFEAPDDVATLAPDDTESALWLEETLGRMVDAGSASDPSDQDLELAECMVKLRLCHDAFAVQQMESAAEVTAEAHREGMRRSRGAQQEAEVRAAMEAVIAGRGLTTAYHSIVTTEGHVLHHERSTLALKDGALLLADVGAESPEGWASDVTRTWPCRGGFSPLQRQIYEAVLQAQAAAIAMLKPGVRFLDVHRQAAFTLVDALVAIGLLRGDTEELLQRGADAVFFPHGIGHLLGLDVHDMEDLGDRAGYAPGRSRSTRAGERFLRLDRDMEPGMVVTIEPGFYCIPSLLDDAEQLRPLVSAIDPNTLSAVRAAVAGIRIEDDVLITDDGHRVLTAACPKDVDNVEGLVCG